MPRYNSASRLRDIINAAVQRRTHENGLKIWAQLLHVNAQDPYDLHFETVSLLSAVRDEAKLVEQVLKDHGLIDDHLRQQLHHLYEGVSMNSLFRDFNQTATMLHGGVQSMLTMAVALMPDDGSKLSQKDLEQLWAYREELANRLGDETLEPALKAFLTEQLRLIDRALAEYPVKGGATFRARTFDAFTNYAQHPEVERDFKDHPAVKTVLQFWSLAWRTAGAMGHVHAAIEAGEFFRGLLN